MFLYKSRRESGHAPGQLVRQSVLSRMRLTAFLSMAAKVVLPKDYRYGMSRPWTESAKKRNPLGKQRRKVFIEPIASQDWSVFKGDTVSLTTCFALQKSIKMSVYICFTVCFCATLFQVEILAGKDKGKQGKVVQVIRKRNWVVLEGLNTVRTTQLLLQDCLLLWC